MSDLKSSHRRRARWALVLAGLCIPALAGGEDSSPSVWERLRGLVSEEDTPMEETLESQRRLEAAASAQRQADRLRLMQHARAQSQGRRGLRRHRAVQGRAQALDAELSVTV